MMNEPAKSKQNSCHDSATRGASVVLRMPHRASLAVFGGGRNENCGSAVCMGGGIVTLEAGWLRFQRRNPRESDMTSETQIHVIARQMLEQHGGEAIAQAARNALASERRGDPEDAREWRHLEDAMKLMRGPHQS